MLQWNLIKLVSSNFIKIYVLFPGNSKGYASPWVEKLHLVAKWHSSVQQLNICEARCGQENGIIARFSHNRVKSIQKYLPSWGRHTRWPGLWHMGNGKRSFEMKMETLRRYAPVTEVGAQSVCPAQIQWILQNCAWRATKKAQWNILNSFYTEQTSKSFRWKNSVATFYKFIAILF